MHIRFILVIIFGFLLSCKSVPDKSEDIIVSSEETYNKASALLAQKKYKQASEEFANVYYQHPGGHITPDAQLMEAYCDYLNKKYDFSIDVLNWFIKLHPANKDISYAYYLKSQALFMQMIDVHYDQSLTLRAIDALNDVITKFPKTDYAQDAKEKLEVAKDYLAAKNMEIGRYYLIARNNPIAALGRFKDVSDELNNQTPEALYRLRETFLVMGLNDEAKLYADHLVQKFPTSIWALKLSKANNVDTK